MIRSATFTAGSCSQNRRTVQPASRSETFVSSSRTRLRETFIAQKSALVLATVWWWGQPCQKHPSMKIATLERVKTKSALSRRRSDNGAKSTRYRNPAACTRLRTASSGRVSRLRLPIIERRVCSLDAHDSATPPVSPLRVSGMRSGQAAAVPIPSRSATVAGSSCSHTTATVQPAPSIASTCSARSTVRRLMSAFHHVWDLVPRAHCGQP